MYPHRIRLRGPWEADPLDPLCDSRRVMLPASFGDCGLGEFRRVRFRRRFGRPRQIDDHERVWLIGEGLTGKAEISLNGRHLLTHGGKDGPFAIPVTDLLADRNELAIELEMDGPDSGLWGDVALEIRCRAYLANLRVEPGEDGRRLRILGEVGGDADGPLEIYALADGHTIGYRTCTAGERFELLTDELSETPEQIRVDLVNVSVVWFAADLANR